MRKSRERGSESRGVREVAEVSGEQKKLVLSVLLVESYDSMCVYTHVYLDIPHVIPCGVCVM